MSDLLHSLSTASSGMDAQARRLRHVSENIANADTPGYRRKTIPFEARTDRTSGALHVQPGRVRLDPGPRPRVHDPTHPMADDTGYYDGSSVNLLIEMADAREASRSYEANLRMFDQARQMTQGLIDLLRR